MTADGHELPVIEFVRPIPGFPDHHRFVLTRVADDNDVLFVLRAIDPPAVRFLVVAPAPFFPDYAPEIDDDTLTLLDVRDADEAERLLVLLVVSVGTDDGAATANLLAPILVDQVSRRAVQAVLTGDGLPLRAPLAVAGV
jgi:flagellar assembly factor FliW